MKRKIPVMILVALLAILAFPLTAFADGGINMPSVFNSLSGNDEQYLREPYVNNYSLDLVKLSIVDGQQSITNSLANAIFMLIYFMGKVTVILFYQCFSIDLAMMLGATIDSFTKNVKDLLFDSFFILAFVTSAFFICKQMLKRNTQAIISEVLKVVILVAISIAMTTNASGFLTAVNSITKTSAAKALSGINGSSVEGNSINDYAAQAAGGLWSSLVHTPWELLEFGEEKKDNDGDVQAILSTSPRSLEREAVVNSLNSSAGYFEKDFAGFRLGLALVYILPTIVKCLLFILVAALQIAFQFFTIILMFLCPVILLMAISPSLGGIDLVWSWLWKIFENCFTVFILTFATGLVVLLDVEIVKNFMGLGWFVVILLQICLLASLIVFREKIIKLLLNASKVVRNPRDVLDRTTDISAYASLPPYTKRKVKSNYRNTRRFLRGTVRDISHAGHDAANSVSYVGHGVASVAKSAYNGALYSHADASNMYNEIKDIIKDTMDEHRRHPASSALKQPENIGAPQISSPATSRPTSPTPANVINVNFKSAPRYERSQPEDMSRPSSAQRPDSPYPAQSTSEYAAPPRPISTLNRRTAAYKPGSPDHSDPAAPLPRDNNPVSYVSSNMQREQPTAISQPSSKENRPAAADERPTPPASSVSTSPDRSYTTLPNSDAHAYTGTRTSGRETPNRPLPPISSTRQGGIPARPQNASQPLSRASREAAYEKRRVINK